MKKLNFDKVEGADFWDKQIWSFCVGKGIFCDDQDNATDTVKTFDFYRTKDGFCWY